MRGFNNVIQKSLPGHSDLFITWQQILTCWKKGVSHKELVESVRIGIEASQSTMLSVPSKSYPRETWTLNVRILLAGPPTPREWLDVWDYLNLVLLNIQFSPVLILVLVSPSKLSYKEFSLWKQALEDNNGKLKAHIYFCLLLKPYRTQSRSIFHKDINPRGKWNGVRR